MNVDWCGDVGFPTVLFLALWGVLKRFSFCNAFNGCEVLASASMEMLNVQMCIR